MLVYLCGSKTQCTGTVRIIAPSSIEGETLFASPTNWNWFRLLRHPQSALRAASSLQGGSLMGLTVAVNGLLSLSMWCLLGKRRWVTASKRLLPKEGAPAGGG